MFTRREINANEYRARLRDDKDWLPLDGTDEWTDHWYNSRTGELAIREDWSPAGKRGRYYIYTKCPASS